MKRSLLPRGTKGYHWASDARGAAPGSPKTGAVTPTLDSLLAIAQTCFTVAGSTLLGEDRRAIFDTRCLRGIKRPQGWRGRRRNVVRRGSDIFGECEVTSRKKCERSECCDNCKAKFQLSQHSLR